MDPARPHVVFLPSAGMGHLTPFSRLAASLSDHCIVTMISVLPTVSEAESRHYTDLFSNYSNINPLYFQLPRFDTSAYPNADAFLLRWKHIGESASEIFDHLLANSPFPISALITDIPIASSILPLTKSAGMPCYILFTSTAAMLSFLKYFPTYHDSNPVGKGDCQLPGLRTIPVASFPRPLRDPNHLFTKIFIESSKVLDKSDGIIVNTFESLEPDSLAWLRAQPGFPPIIPVVPLMPVKNPISTISKVLTWLNEQPERSVVYSNFGSRSAMSKEQIKELGLGLEASNCRFVCIIKTSIVDADEQTELDELFGKGFLERVKDRGLVTKEWVDQEEVLQHKAVGGFVSHCGSNSVIEAAMHGVRVLAWPSVGDQKINAGVVVRSGFGVWPEGWSWDEEEGIIKAAEIGRRVKEMMADESLLEKAQKFGEAVKKAATTGNGLAELVKKFKELFKNINSHLMC